MSLIEIERIEGILLINRMQVLSSAQFGENYRPLRAIACM